MTPSKFEIKFRRCLRQHDDLGLDVGGELGVTPELDEADGARKGRLGVAWQRALLFEAPDPERQRHDAPRS